MTIYLGSRYETSVVDFVAFNSSYAAYPVVFYEFTDMGRLQYNTYVWKDGDRLDQVAATFYLHPEYWWLLAEYNPEIEDPHNIASGTILRIPLV
jgi:nucleoid-associated protein YgaU